MATQYSNDNNGVTGFIFDGVTKYDKANSVNVSGWSKQPGGPGNYFKTLTESTGKVTHNSTPIGGEH